MLNGISTADISISFKKKRQVLVFEMWWNTTNSVLRITTCLILTKWLARAVVNLYWSKVIERIRLHRWSWYNCLEITVLTTMHFLKVIFLKAKRKKSNMSKSFEFFIFHFFLMRNVHVCVNHNSNHIL